MCICREIIPYQDQDVKKGYGVVFSKTENTRHLNLHIHLSCTLQRAADNKDNNTDDFGVRQIYERKEYCAKNRSEKIQRKSAQIKNLRDMTNETDLIKCLKRSK